VPTLEEAFKRLREYLQPLEDQRLKQNFGLEAKLDFMLRKNPIVFFSPEFTVLNPESCFCLRYQFEDPAVVVGRGPSQ
jgi:hypothetical protein